MAVKWALLCYKVEWHSSLHVGVLRVQCQRNNQLHAFQSLRNTNMGQSHGLHSNDSNAGLVGGERQQEEG